MSTTWPQLDSVKPGPPASIAVGRRAEPVAMRRSAEAGASGVRDPFDGDVISPSWRAHDRTHLELPVPIPVGDRAAGAEFLWEAYFFVPESFRLNKHTYDKSALDTDFKSYVRLAVGDTQLHQLSVAMEALEKGLDRETDEAVHELRLFACRARSVFTTALARLEDETLERPAPGEIRAVADGLVRILTRFRQVTQRVDDGTTDELAVATRWVDEDLSLSAEATLVRCGKLLEEEGGPHHDRVVEVAVAEAQYRLDAGYAGVVESSVEVEDAPSSRTMERLEFRRHTLKRFTASILWLSSTAEDPAKWAKHALYAVAACFAMGFAVFATILNGPVVGRADIGAWLLVAVGGYAVKDRIKASLQEVFSGVLSRHFADRRWRVRDRADTDVAIMEERSGFADFDGLPEPVLAARRITREHPIEEEARPESVLWHQKKITVAPNVVHDDYAGLLEIFRVDLRRWLVNTDEAKNDVLFANPTRGEIEERSAPRVYNIALVYRCTDTSAEQDAAWRRARVVVTRKGIRRIEQIR